jgi:hypothetical protein
LQKRETLGGRFRKAVQDPGKEKDVNGQDIDQSRRMKANVKFSLFGLDTAKVSK